VTAAVVVGVVVGLFVIGYALVMMAEDGLGKTGNPQGGGGFEDEMRAREHAHNQLVYGALIGIACLSTIGIVLRRRLGRAIRHVDHSE
jgi:hypothetical protein